MAEALPHMVWTATPDGDVDYISREMLRLGGLAELDPRGGAWLQVVHPDDHESVLADWRQAIASGRDYSTELRLAQAGGGWRWHLAAARPHRDAGGRIVKWYGSAIDIHDRKLAQEALRRSEERLRAILEHEPECVKVVSADGVLIDMNPAGLAMIEAGSAEEVIGRVVGQLVHPDDRETYFALHRQAIAGQSGRASFRVTGLKGRECWMESHAVPLRGPGGVVEAVLSVTRDVTERRRAEAALLEVKERQELILAATAEGIHGIDLDGNIVFENAAALSMLGYERAEMLGRPAHWLIHHHHADGSPYPIETCPIHLTLQDGRTRHVAGEAFFRKDGTSFPADYTVVAMKGADGAATGAVVTFRDVTSARREAELQALEARVLDLVGSGAGLREVLTDIAATVDRLLHGVRSSILVAEGGRLWVMAAPNLPEDFNREIDGLPIGEGFGSCGTAAWRRQPVMVPDILADPLFTPYVGLARQYGLAASWSIPVLDADGAVLATFAMYHATPCLPEDGDHAFIARVGRHVRTAIERQRAAEALRNSERRLRVLAENLQEVLWMTTPEKDRIIYVSPAYEAIWGRRCEDLHANPWQWLEAIHPDDRPRVAAAAVRQAEGGYAQEYRILRPDGTMRWISDRAFPVPAEDGSIQQVVGIARDVTATKHVELQLRERLKELGCLYKVRSLVSDHARPVSDICQDIVALLPASLLHAEVGVARIQLDGIDCRSEGWREPLAAIRLPIRRGDSAVGRIEIGYAEGQVAGAHPFLPEEHEMLGAVADQIGDMLDRRDMAARLTQAERLNAIGQLTGGVAHDFNNLLTVILGNSEVLAEQLATDPGLRALAEMTAKAAERGAELTSRLLAFSRRQPLSPRVVDVGRQLDGMNRLLHRTLGAQVEIRTVHPPGLWPALVDPGQLENAVLNLCLNARDAMPRGGRLTVETANVRLDAGNAARDGDFEPGDYVMVAVSDTGIGMDDATMRRAFEPFFTTKEVGKGSGLGLSMVYGFVKQSNGHVRLYSEPGQGTTVKLYLPRAPEAADAAARPGAEGALPVGQERVLLVEDDELVRAHVGRLLAGLGYRVVAVRDGPAALARLREDDGFDLLFTDIVMPGGIDGRQLAEAARRLHPGLPVLFTSGYAENAIIHQGRLAPGVHLLQKPYRRQDLAEKIRLALAGDGPPHPRSAR